MCAALRASRPCSSSSPASRPSRARATHSARQSAARGARRRLLRRRHADAPPVICQARLPRLRSLGSCSASPIAVLASPGAALREHWVRPLCLSGLIGRDRAGSGSAARLVLAAQGAVFLGPIAAPAPSRIAGWALRGHPALPRSATCVLVVAAAFFLGATVLASGAVPPSRFPTSGRARRRARRSRRCAVIPCRGASPSSWRCLAPRCWRSIFSSSDGGGEGAGRRAVPGFSPRSISLANVLSLFMHCCRLALLSGWDGRALALTPIFVLAGVAASGERRALLASCS